MSKHLYPAAPADRRPSPLWYFGWAAYVNRRGYLRALAAGAPASLLLLALRLPAAAAALIAVGALVLLFSLAGIYRMYGPPAARYLRRLLDLGGVPATATIADLHIGTWRTSHLLVELRPRARLHSVDCWNVEGPPAEANVRQLHELEPRPLCPTFTTLAARAFRVPLPTASCDAVVLGFGIHELPPGGPRERIFDEARRLVRPGGKLLLFEHLVDLENFAIFGPGIDHWPRRHDWRALLAARFPTVTHERARQGVDLFVAGVG
jgi:SAM-dependent methyltransferase